MLVNTGEKRGFVPKRGELEERCGKVGGVKKCEKREARSEKREAKKLYVLNNAPEIEVGAVV